MPCSWFSQSATGSPLGVVVQAMSSFCPSGPVNRSPAEPLVWNFHPFGNPIEYPWLPRYVEVTAPSSAAPAEPEDPSELRPLSSVLGVFPAPAPASGEEDAVVASSLRVPPLSSSLVSALVLAPPGTLEPPPFAPSLSSPPSVRASTVPRTASATTTAMITRVRRGTTSVSGALGTSFGDRSDGGVITAHPELRPSETALACCVFPSRTPAVPLEADVVADVEADPDGALAAPFS